MVEKIRNEDLSIYFFVKDALVGKVTNILDSYPFIHIIQNDLEVPAVSIDHRTTEEDAGELGSSWFRRSWAIDIFAENDTKRDDMADIIFQALDNSIPIRDYSAGYRKSDGKSLLGADLRIIEYVSPEDRSMRTKYAFNEYNELKFWQATIEFDTVSTQAS